MRPWQHRSSVWLLVLLRGALLVIVFHASGVAHFAADVHEIVTTGHHAGTPLDQDDDAPWQAPGSPSCHHAQPSGASLASPYVARVHAGETGRLEIAKPFDRAPTPPPLQSVYRPPRA